MSVALVQQPVRRRRSKTVRAKPVVYSKPVIRRTYARAYPTRATGYGAYALYKAPKMVRPSKAATESLGGALGANIGHGIHAVIKGLTGFGDYTINENSIMSGLIGGSPPVIQNTANNSFIVRHREYIGDVFASNSFSVTTYPINPGLPLTFPWLSQMSDSYEQYKFRGLVFEYKSMSSDAVLSASSSSALGTVVMSTQYNVLDTPFTDKRTMENYEFANSDKPSCSFYHPVECKMSQTSVAELYVRTGAASVGDLRLYDLGSFSIAVQGMQNAGIGQVIGELWATFEIEFYKPKLLVGGGALLTDHFASTGANIVTTALPFGSGGIPARSGNNLGCTFNIAGGGNYGPNSLVFPSYVVDGYYLITYSMNGATPTASNSPQLVLGTTVNVDVVSTSVKLFTNNTANFAQSPNAGLTTNNWTFQMVCRILQTAPGLQPAVCFVPTGTMPSGTQNVDLFVTQINPSIN